MPRGLTGRIVLAFVGLAAASLLAIGGALFVVLSRAYSDDVQSNLVSVSVALAARPNVLNAGRIPVETLVGPRGDITGNDFSVYVARSGSFDLVAGSDVGVDRPPLEPAGTTRTAKGRTGSSNGGYLYGATILGAAGRATTGMQAVVVVTPDRSQSRALGSLAIALVAVLAVLLAIGAPVAWLLARSVIRPIRRLERASAEVAAASARAEPPALPVEGPAEVRDLTANFNRMASELATARREEEEILANLRHDLRTPLTSISGFGEAIADGTVEGEGARAAARTIVEESARLERLVGELGLVERLRSGAAALHPEQLDAGEVVRAASARFETQGRSRGIAIEVATAQGPAHEPSAGAGLSFAADRLAVERMLQNLVVNALAAATEGGHVWLAASRYTPPDRQPGIVLSVTDDGPGFPPGTADRVFDRFFRADPSRTGRGTGLGLAIVRELARAHGGEAWAENVAPHGARVSVFLPSVPPVGGASGAVTRE